MILGRPTNLWLGAIAALLGLVQIVLVTIGADPVAVATILGAVGLFLGAVVALIANGPATVNPGDSIIVKTAAGSPDYRTTVATPPAQDPPPSPVPGT